jgi:hypothetical protein
VPWRGKLHVIGLKEAVRAVFLPQKRPTYWKQEIGFTTHPPPDYPNEGRRLSPRALNADAVAGTIVRR